MHTHLNDDGAPVYVEIKAYPVRDAAGEVVYAIEVIKDVTRRVLLEEELRQAQKMEAVGRLVGGVVHDFNNILSAITGYGELLQMDAEEGDESWMAIDEILAAAERATRLTRSLLAFSHKERTELAMVNVNEVIRGIDKLLRRLLGEDVELDFHLAEGEVLLHADRYQIEQVVMNLAVNARDAMVGGGLFAVATEVVELVGGEAEVGGLTTPGTYCLLSVSDTGKGIDAAIRPRVFEPFFTTKHSSGGTGLGLSMVSRIIDSHGGRVVVESRVGLGTTFRIYLPLCDANVARPADPPSTPRDLPGGSETVLVAEDDEAVRSLMVRLLKAHGYRVVVARNGADAVDLCREHGGGIDLYIVDVVMPSIGGEALLQKLHSIHAEARVLFISGYPVEVLRHRGFLGAIPDLLVKPISRASLLHKVRAILDGCVAETR